MLKLFLSHLMISSFLLPNLDASIASSFGILSSMFYSQHWRTWAAFFIQAALRRHCRNKLEKSLREKEDILQAVLISEIANLPSLGLLLLCDGGDLDCARKKVVGNLCSLGQDLKTSNFVWEILFAIFICIVGLILFSLLIGNMQSITVRVEGMRLRRRDAKQWMSHCILPDNLRKRIQRYKQYKWLQTRGVDEHYLIFDILKDLRRDVKRHLCWFCSKE
ncbi:hypothetical protein P3S68_028159 [Capsicum galapagoense]